MTDTFPVVYERATTPTTGPAPGAEALMDWAVDNHDRAVNLGIYSRRRIGGTRWWSVHAEGRALDVGFPLVRGGHPEGHRLAQTLVDHHRQLGVQQVIWALRAWRNTVGVWRGYGGPSPHLDHVHVELTRQAGRQLTPGRIRRTLGDTDPMIPENVVAAYLRGGREPSAQEVHAWTVDCTRKREAGIDLDPTYRYIEHAVRNEP